MNFCSLLLTRQLPSYHNYIQQDGYHLILIALRSLNTPNPTSRISNNGCLVSYNIMTTTITSLKLIDVQKWQWKTPSFGNKNEQDPSCDNVVHQSAHIDLIIVIHFSKDKLNMSLLLIFYGWQMRSQST